MSLVKALYISSTPEGIDIALTENRKLVEFIQEPSNKHFSVGDVYVGKVKKINTSLNAAFVDIGHEKDAFLHYLDLGSQFLSFKKYLTRVNNKEQRSPKLHNFERELEINKNGKIKEVIDKNDLVLVQVVKEAISTKGLRLTSEISLAGRFVVLVPFSDVISVSKKIKSNDERRRLKTLITTLKPKGFGIIVRTASEEKTNDELSYDVNDLIKKWELMLQKIQNSKPPTCVVQEISRTTGMLRDILNDSFNNIVIDDDSTYHDVKEYVKTYAPELATIVKPYNNGKITLFEANGIDKQLKNLFTKTVTFSGGAYIIIEHTEALHVIDVNSGSRPNAVLNQEDNVFAINCDAAAEIARQLRLRDMGGIIVIDFIDMKRINYKKDLHLKMVEYMQHDRAKHVIIPISKFGLMQITRQRVRPEINIITTENCTACEGTGQTRPTSTIIGDIESALRFIITEQNETKIALHTHPFIAAYLKQKLYDKQRSWLLKYGKWIKIIPTKTFHINQYQFTNANDELISL